jgi:hypothetical protein
MHLCEYVSEEGGDRDGTGGGGDTSFVYDLVTQGCQRTQGFLPQLDELYFTTVEKKLLENYR